MNTQMIKVLSFLMVLLMVAPNLRAAEPQSDAASAAPTPAAADWDHEDHAQAKPHADDDDDDDDDADVKPEPHTTHHHWHHQGDNELVSIFHNAHLPAGEKADEVVSVFGSASSEGEAGDVVAVFGETDVSGEAHGDAVAVFGNLTVDAPVHGDAVAVFGSVHLGPHAVIDGDVTAVFGAVTRDPAAVIRGDQHAMAFGGLGQVEWLHAWLRECLAKGRPLAFAPQLDWAWGIAIGLLCLYLVVAVVFREGVIRCIETLEREPGHSALAAFLLMLLTPVLLALLCVTFIGIAAVPFVLFALLVLSLFGKAVILAWVGKRVLIGRPAAPVLAVLVGGVIATLLYTIPVVGFLVYKLLGFFGVGAVVYTLLQAQRARQEARADRLHRSPPAGPSGPTYTPPPGGAGTASAAAFAAAAATASSPAAGETPNPASASAEAAMGGAPADPSATSAPPPPPGAAPLSHGPTPAEMATYPRAGFWVRMVALLIDGLLVGFALHLGHGYGTHHLHLVALAIYGAIMWKLRGSTIGGMALDLRVVRLDGRPIEWETAIVRALACFLSLFVAGLGFIWIAIDPQHQAWHDKIAGTVVVRVPKGTPHHG